jgi:HEAT repeat protein
MGVLGIIGKKEPDVETLKSEKDIDALLEATNFSSGISEESRKAAYLIRIDAIRALGDLGGSNAEEGLVRMNGVRSERLQNHIVDALIAIGTPSSLQVAAEKLVPYVRANNPDEERAPSKTYDDVFVQDWRVFARDKLREIGKPAVPVLMLTLDNEYLDPYKRAGAADILGKIADPGSLDTLINASFDGNEVVQASARAALERGSHNRHHLKQQLLKDGWGRQDIQ